MPLSSTNVLVIEGRQFLRNPETDAEWTEEVAETFEAEFRALYHPAPYKPPAPEPRSPVVPAANTAPISRYAFRRRFPIAKRIAIDNAVQGSISDEDWAMFRTLQEDFRAADVIHLDDPETIDGVNFLATLGFIASNEAADILSGK